VALLVAAAVAVIMLGVTPDRADATPVYSACYPGDEVAFYNWAYDEYGNFSDFIEMNECALDRLGAGPIDRERVLEHEMGHANGNCHSDHGGDIMYPYMVMWGV
jgi:hypothetical protein